MDEIKEQDFLTEEQVYDKLEISKIDKFSFVSKRTKKLMTKKDIENENNLYYLNCNLERLKEYGDNDFVKNKDIDYVCSTLTFKCDEHISDLTVYVEKEQREVFDNKPFNPIYTFYKEFDDNIKKDISFPIKNGYYYDYTASAYEPYKTAVKKIIGNVEMKGDRTIDINSLYFEPINPTLTDKITLTITIKNIQNSTELRYTGINEDNTNVNVTEAFRFNGKYVLEKKAVKNTSLNFIVTPLVIVDYANRKLVSVTIKSTNNKLKYGDEYESSFTFTDITHNSGNIVGFNLLNKTLYLKENIDTSIEVTFNYEQSSIL